MPSSSRVTGTDSSTSSTATSNPSGKNPFPGNLPSDEDVMSAAERSYIFGLELDAIQQMVEEAERSGDSELTKQAEERLQAAENVMRDARQSLLDFIGSIPIAEPTKVFGVRSSPKTSAPIAVVDTRGNTTIIETMPVSIDFTLVFDGDSPAPVAELLAPLAIASNTALMVFKYETPDDDIEVEEVTSIYVDVNERHYVQTRDGHGLILPPPKAVEVFAKPGQPIFKR
jgi:hypothetical protein